MSNSPLPISNLPNVQSTGLTPNDLLVVVNYDLPSGTTKNITTDEFKTYVTLGITNPFTGGTISGSTEFTNGLTANTLTVNGVSITGDYLPLSGGVMDDNAIIQFDNFSQLREGTYDFGGQGGISQICGVGYENNWQAGINHIFDSNGFIRESLHCFNIIPDNTFDSSLRFKIGSRWVLDNGDIYVCSDDSVGAAVWYLEINDTYVTGGTYFTGGTIIFDYNTGSNFQVTGLTEDLNNEIAGLAETDEETIELNLTTNKIQLKETVASATGGTRTFQGDFAISGGTLNLDTIGSGSPVINLGLDSSGEVVTGQTVTITGGTNIEIVGSYPDFGINYTGTTGGEYLPLSGGTVTGDTTFTSGLTANTLNIGGTNVVLTNLQQTPIVVSGNTTAENDKVYHVIANATFTDPTGIEGKGYVVLVINGTATIGGSEINTAYTIVYRLFISGAWQTRSYIHSGTIASLYVPQSRTINGLNLSTDRTLTAINVSALPISGGTVTGATSFTSGLTATTISATTYQNLPVSALTEGTNISITNTSGNHTISVTGLTNIQQINPYNNSGSGSTINWNVSGTSTNYDATLTATTTLNLTNVRNGDFGTIIIRQDGVGGRTLTLGTVNGSSTTHRVVNGGGGSIILTTNANAIDILTFTYNGSIMFWTVGNDYT